jgi:hypothetical protein
MIGVSGGGEEINSKQGLEAETERPVPEASPHHPGALKLRQRKQPQVYNREPRL